MLERDLAGEDLEEESLVCCTQGVGVAQGELELGGVVLRVHRLQGNVRVLTRLPARVDDPARVDRGARAVDEGARRVEGLPTTVAVGLEEVGLELHPDERRVAERLPVSDGALQRGPR